MKVIHTHTHTRIGFTSWGGEDKGVETSRERKEGFHQKGNIYYIREKNKKASFIFCVDVGRWRRQQQQQQVRPASQPAGVCR
jgi:cAMP phosphodiesterase